MIGLSVLSDSAVKASRDLLNFDRYINVLVSIFTNPKTETPFTIGIFGSWGSGKSSLLEMLDERIEKDFQNGFLRVHFNPWIHRGETNMLVPLLHTLRDTLLSESVREVTKPKVAEQFAKSAQKISTILLKLGADILLKHLTADAVTLEKLDKLEETYNKEHSKVESEIRNLRSVIQQELDQIAEDGAKVILFIDDLDRCEPLDIINLLEAIKLFFDLRHIFIILAIDKEVIDRGIEIKYNNFKFASDRAITLGAEYLEKMIQLPLQLFPLHKNQVRGFIESLHPSQVVLDQLDLLQVLVSPNPRKIKRILNILGVTNAIIEATLGKDTLKLDLVTRLIVLQVQSSDLYADITKQSDVLIALESVFKGNLRVDVEADFTKFGSRKRTMQDLCKKYYQPDSYLGTLFKDSAFSEVEGRLSSYLTLLRG
jgi:hypothetical protein